MPFLPTPIHQLPITVPPVPTTGFACSTTPPGTIPLPMNCTNLELCSIPATSVKGTAIDLVTDSIASADDLMELAAIVDDLVANGGTGTPQTLSISGQALSISNGNTVLLPKAFAAASVVPNTDPSASIPTTVVGTDDFLLANPVPTGGAWLLVDGTTDQYIPVYRFI